MSEKKNPVGVTPTVEKKTIRERISQAPRWQKFALGAALAVGLGVGAGAGLKEGCNGCNGDDPEPTPAPEVQKPEEHYSNGIAQFEFDSNAVEEPTPELLVQHVEDLIAQGYRRFTIAGFASPERTHELRRGILPSVGPDAYNDALSKRRASALAGAVQDIAYDAGLDADEIEVFPAGCGETDALDPYSLEPNRAAVVFPGEIADICTVDDIPSGFSIELEDDEYDSLERGQVLNLGNTDITGSAEPDMDFSPEAETAHDAGTPEAESSATEDNARSGFMDNMDSVIAEAVGTVDVERIRDASTESAPSELYEQVNDLAERVNTKSGEMNELYQRHLELADARAKLGPQLQKAALPPGKRSNNSDDYAQDAFRLFAERASGISDEMDELDREYRSLERAVRREDDPELQREIDEVGRVLTHDRAILRTHGADDYDNEDAQQEKSTAPKDPSFHDMTTKTGHNYASVLQQYASADGANVAQLRSEQGLDEVLREYQSREGESLRGLRTAAKTVERNDLMTRAQELRAEGMTYKQIGAEIGRSASTASRYCNTRA